MKDIAAALAVVGVLYFFYVRAKVKPDRMTRSGEAVLILAFIGLLMVTEFMFGGAMRWRTASPSCPGSRHQRVRDADALRWASPAATGWAWPGSGST